MTLPGGLRLFFDGDAPAGGGPYPTSRLRRGLLLADAARELAEEGVGFGVPVVKRGLETVFPGTVALTAARHGQVWEAQAVFGLDLVERLAARGGPTLQARPLYAAKDALAALHRRAPALRGALTATSSALRRGLRWRTVYVPGEPAGTVTVRYRVEPHGGAVTVTADLSGLRRDGLSEVAFMNELGARLFDRYRDADGAVLQSDEIGAWHEVTAAQAGFYGSGHDVCFSVPRLPGARLYRGRELVGARLAWSGFGYVLPPAAASFRYEVRVGRQA